MDIDLRERGISRLCFSAAETTEEEATVASAVSVLLADHNQIHHVNGLDSVFVNLVELRLSHNQLGRASTPYYRVNHSALSGDGSQRCCSGVASWVQALPATLEVLDVSFNHLHSFLECTCECSGAAASPRSSGADAPPLDEPELLMRALRHCCPLAVPLFFSAARFPRLRELHLAHNAFAASLRESDEMQACFDSYCAAFPGYGVVVAASETIDLLDLSFNEGVAALNCFLLAKQPATEEATGSSDGENGLPPTKCTVLAGNTSIEDLQGISAVSLYRPAVRWSLQLHPCPVSRSVLAAPPLVLVDLLHMVANTLEDAHAVAAELQKPPLVDGSLANAMGNFNTAAHLAELETIVQNEVSHDDPQLSEACSVSESWVATLAYVCLLHQVVPTLDTVDAALPVTSCERLLLSSLRRLLFAPSVTHLTPTSRRLPAGAPPLHPAPCPSTSALQPRGLGSAASFVTPELRSRVVVGGESHSDPSVDGAAPEGTSVGPGAWTEGGRSILRDGGARPGRFQAALAALRPSRSSSATPATTRTPSADSAASSSAFGVDGAAQSVETDCGEDLFMPSSLTAEDRSLYQTLCREAKELQAAVLASNERCREFRSQSDALRRQLTQDRTLVADQLKEVTRLRQEKAELERSVELQRHRLEKRQKEVQYGVTAIQAREAAARERAAMERIAAREKEVARRERQLRQRAARAGTLAVEYHSDGPSGQRKKLRSEVLREAAVRKRLAEQENKDPLAYAPAPFKSDARRSTPRTSPDQKVAVLTSHQVAAADEERAYFELYGALAGPGLQEVADHYVAQLRPPQRQQLREASTHLPSSGSRGSSAPRRDSSPMGGSPFSDEAVGSNVPGLSTSPEGGRDLSSLSLSELLDAAAAIRQKQLALQQLQQQWKQPPPPFSSPPPPPPPADVGGEKGENHQTTLAMFRSDIAPDAAPAAPGDGSVSFSLAGDEHRSARDCAGDVPLTARAAHPNSPFCSTLSEAPHPSSAQQLFDMVLAQQTSPQSYGKGGIKDSSEAVPPTRSPFSTQQSEVHHYGEDNLGGGTADEPSSSKLHHVAAERPQINRALFQ